MPNNYEIGYPYTFNCTGREFYNLAWTTNSINRAMNSWKLFIISVLVSTTTLEGATLFSHSSATSLNVVDDMSVQVSLTTPLYFHDNSYSQIYVSENGMVTFDIGFYGGISHPLSNKWIAPFGSDVAPFIGQVKHQTLTVASAPGVLTTATDLVAEIYPDDMFDTQELFVVTWANVQRPTGIETNTFQLALATDGASKSYAIFLYEDINYYPGVVGISAGDSSTHWTVCNTDKYGTTFLPIKSTSQCATRGVIVFRIDQTTWNQPGYTCTPVYTTGTCTGAPTSRQCSAG